MAYLLTNPTERLEWDWQTYENDHIEFAKELGWEVQWLCLWIGLGVAPARPHGMNESIRNESQQIDLTPVHKFYAEYIIWQVCATCFFRPCVALNLPSSEALLPLSWWVCSPSSVTCASYQIVVVYAFLISSIWAQFSSQIRNELISIILCSSLMITLIGVSGIYGKINPNSGITNNKPCFLCLYSLGSVIFMVLFLFMGVFATVYPKALINSC